jgi:hypothetical protein
MVQTLVTSLKNDDRMLSFLRMMYYFGLLPINWITTDEADLKFEISTLKSLVMLIFDILVASMIPAYFCIWHWLNIEGFKFTQLLDLNYYVSLNGGFVTTALCQLVYITFPVTMLWVYCWNGKNEKKTLLS